MDPYRIHTLSSPNPATRAYTDWISRSDSMTRAIAVTRGEMPRVHPLREGPARLAPWEGRLLGHRRNRAYAREVVLTTDEEPVLVARTVSRLEDPALNVIRKLGSRPLAELLFEDPDWRRASPLIPLIELGPRRIGRTCLWAYGRSGQSRILVTELFEPGKLESWT
jgi:chorismate-pyruvate lyase